MSMFTFKAYDPAKHQFIDLESDNSTCTPSPESQQVSVPRSSGARNASAGLLALGKYARDTYDPFSPSVVHPIPPSSPLLDDRDPLAAYVSTVGIVTVPLRS
jgi:hypothetical protein